MDWFTSSGVTFNSNMRLHIVLNCNKTCLALTFIRHISNIAFVSIKRVEWKRNHRPCVVLKAGGVITVLTHDLCHDDYDGEDDNDGYTNVVA